MTRTEFKSRLKKSIEEVDNDYSLIDYSIPEPRQEDYKTFKEYWYAMSNLEDGYLYLKYKYTYGSRLKEEDYVTLSKLWT